MRTALVTAHIERRENENRHRRGRKILLAILALLVILVVSIAALAEYILNAPVQALVATPRAFPSDSLVYDRTGTLIADIHRPGVSRIPVALSDVSPDAIKATLAIEDRNFWNEGPIDVARFIGAALADLEHKGNLQGASTIPMQLAKLLYLKDTHTIAYKAQEISIAAHLVNTMTKQHILDDYLNDISYANSAIGIQAAAHIYFGIDAAKLDLAQAAYLAGLPNAPTEFDPFVNPAAAKNRQLAVLDAMNRYGFVDQARYVAAANEPIHLSDGRMDNLNAAPAFVHRALSDLQKLTKADPATDGLRITTTIDMRLQSKAAEAVATQISTLGALNVTDGALVSIDPTTGQILAYVGNAGPNAPGNAIDMASVSRQPGSTFKLFTYTTAVMNKTITMLTPVLDGPITFPKGGGPQGEDPYVPLDYDRKFHGIMPAEKALGNSINTAAIRVEEAVGLPKIIDFARSMGVTTLTQPDSSYGPSTTLGTAAIPLWEMAQAGSVFADAGVLHPAHALLKVVDARGVTLPVPGTTSKTVFSPQVAAIMNDVLSNDSNRWLEFGQAGLLTLPGHRVAAKTGTTEDFKDNLTVGWTPALATATWVGNADDSAMQGTTGITGAAPIWNQFMRYALNGVADDWPAPPAGISQQTFGGGTAYLLDGTTPQLGESATTSRNPGSSPAGLYCWGWYQGHWCGTGMTLQSP